jgi:endo-1,4-beta-xylanase
LRHLGKNGYFVPAMDRRTFLRGTAAATAIGSVPGVAAVPQRASLAEIAARRGLQFGSALDTTSMRNSRYLALHSRECALVTCENGLKWKYLEPEEGERELAEALAVRRYADREGLDVRGHCFLWNREDRFPPWLVELAQESSPGETKALTDTLWRHGAFLGRSFDGIVSWDVMNEAIATDGTMRQSVFSELLGDRFFDLGFRIMRAKSPGAQLVYNETMGWEQSSSQRDAVLRLLEGALRRNVPIDALGVQSHLGKFLGRPRDERGWQAFLAEVEGMGLDVVITELDCSDRNLTDPDYRKRDAEVAAYVKAYLDLTLDFHNVRQVVLWSLSDGVSYMNRDSYDENRRRPDGRPLRGHPYDTRLEPKPMHDAIAAAFASAPVRSA